MTRPTNTNDTPATPKKSRLAVDVPHDLLEQVRDLVAYLQRNGKKGEPDTMAGLVRSFVEDGIARVLKKHKRKTIPKRKAALRQGRPIR